MSKTTKNPTSSPNWATSSRRSIRVLALTAALAAPGCQADPAATPADSEDKDGLQVVDSCDYANSFTTTGRECREYLGGGWGDLSRAEDNCLGTQDSSFRPGEPCPERECWVGATWEKRRLHRSGPLLRGLRLLRSRSQPAGRLPGAGL